MVAVSRSVGVREHRAHGANGFPPIPTDLARELDPAAGSAASALLRQVTEHDRTGLAGQLEAQLRDIVRLLGDPEVRIVFGGHFSCGKSSVINTLIGTPLLPTSDFPETGVPCAIRAGTGNRIQAITDGGRVGLPFSTEAIAREVSLITDSGEYSTAVQNVRHLLISLVCDAPPAGVQWIDSPGINDTSAMTQRATQAADRADVLVWVVNSRQPLSEVEQEFLHAHVATHGPASVVFVVNAFLRADDLTTWTWFLGERAGYFHDRIADAGITDPLPPVVVPVSARAAAADPTGFGGPELHQLLHSFDGTGLNGARNTRVSATRCHRAGQRLQRLAVAVRGQIDEERARVELGHAARAEQERTSNLRRQRFGRQLEQSLATIFTQGHLMIQQRTRHVLESTATQPLRDDNHYGNMLTRELVEIGNRLAEEIVGEANRCAVACGLAGLVPSTISRLRVMLTPRSVVIEVPRTPHSHRPARVGASIAGILDRIGDALNAAAAAGTGPDAATGRDRAAAAANIIAASEAMIAGLMAQQAAVHHLITEPDSTSLALPDPPAEGRLFALTAFHDHLTATALMLVSRVGDDAVRELTR